MASKETRVERGRRRARLLTARCLSELREARQLAGLSQASVAGAIGMSQPGYGRLEAAQVAHPTVERLCELARVLGLEVSLGLHPVGDPLRDKGQLAVGHMFDAMLSGAWRVTNETVLPGRGEQRAWDKLLRLVDSRPPFLVGVDIETRVRDIQALTRRTRGRERNGAVDAIVIVLSDSATKRRLVEELRASLGPAYLKSARTILGALRSGRPLVGSGVVLV